MLYTVLVKKTTICDKKEPLLEESTTTGVGKLISIVSAGICAEKCRYSIVLTISLSEKFKLQFRTTVMLIEITAR
jgi:hypothetical protein